MAQGVLARSSEEAGASSRQAQLRREAVDGAGELGQELAAFAGERGACNFARLRTHEEGAVEAGRVEDALGEIVPGDGTLVGEVPDAVLAIDQLERLLRKVGKRALRNHEIRDELGQPRVVLRTPNWENFVHISFREIRERGAGSLQIERRLRAMIVNLIKTLPAHRHPPLQIELELLDRATVRAHFFPEDIVLARIPDSQGLGGASGVAEQRTVCRDVEMPNDRGGRL